MEVAEVGELVTSPDMAGRSLTVHCSTTSSMSCGRRRPRPPRSGAARCRACWNTDAPPAVAQTAAAAGPAPPPRAPSRCARRPRWRGADAMEAAVAEAEQELGRLDSVAGDEITDGHAARLPAATGRLPRRRGHRQRAWAAGAAFADKAGGTSGMLWGEMLGAAEGRWATRRRRRARASPLRCAAPPRPSRGSAKANPATRRCSTRPTVRRHAGGRARRRPPLRIAWATAVGAAEASAQRTAETAARTSRAATAERRPERPIPARSPWRSACARRPGRSPARDKPETHDEGPARSGAGPPDQESRMLAAVPRPPNEPGPATSRPPSRDPGRC